MEGQRGSDGAEMRVQEYDSLMISWAEEVLQRTFKKRNTRKVKVSEPVWMMEEIREGIDRKSTRLNSSHSAKSRMPSSA